MKYWILLLLLLLCLPVQAQGKVIWSGQTDWGKVLVKQESDERILLFSSESGETEESRMSVTRPAMPRVPYVKQMLAVTALWEAQAEEPPESPRFLVVGLGGASLSVALASRFPSSEIVSVEIEPVVVQAAREHFFYQESDLVQTVVDDARHFLEQNTQPFDVIYLDAFDGVGVPPTLRTVEFAQLLDRNLTSGGAVIANIHFTPEEPSLRYRKALRAVFEHGYVTTGLVAQGIGLYSHQAVSSFALKQNLPRWEEKYRIDLLELLNGRHQESLDEVEPFRDESS